MLLAPSRVGLKLVSGTVCCYSDFEIGYIPEAESQVARVHAVCGTALLDLVQMLQKMGQCVDVDTMFHIDVPE